MNTTTELRSFLSVMQERLRSALRHVIQVLCTAERWNETIIALVIFLVIPMAAQAQYLEDGLRLWQQNSILTARAGAFGTAYNGLADDFAALYVNPAGLTLVPRVEFTVGAQLLTDRTTTNYYGSSGAASLTTPALSHAGIVIPIHSRHGSFAIALGYSRENDFNQNENVAGTNPTSSIVQSWVRNQWGTDLTYNKGYKLYLADTLNGYLQTPIRGGLTQSAFTQQSGGMQNVSAGIGFDVSSSFSVGASLIGSWGRYTYRRSFQENDTRNIYNRLDVKTFTNIDYTSLAADEGFSQSIGGIKAVLGAQGRIGDFMRVGVAITTPGYYQIRETNTWSGSSLFDNGDQKFFTDNATGSYAVTTPWTISGGVSFHTDGLTLTSGIEYADASTMEFLLGSNYDHVDGRTLNEVNTTIRSVLTPQTRWGVGAEYEIPIAPLVVRGSYSHADSPYLTPSLQTALNVIGVGAGFYVAPNVRIDATYRFYKRNYQSSAYSASDAAYTGTQSIGQAAAQVVVRF